MNFNNKNNFRQPFNNKYRGKNSSNYKTRPYGFNRNNNRGFIASNPYKNVAQNLDHTEIVKSGQFYCDTCDRDFGIQSVLDQHIKNEHQKCGIDGCRFVAHPNVITKHIQMQHSSGLYNKIKNLNTPEDIAKWISERKKNYPTKENIEKRKAQQKECMDRGERLFPTKSRFNNNDKKEKYHDKKRRKFNKREFPSKSRVKTKNNNNEMPIQQVVSKINNESQKAEQEEELYCNLKMFKGTSLLRREDLILEDDDKMEANDIDIEDDEWTEDNQNNDVANFAVCNVLGRLIDSYRSSDDEDETELKSPENATENNSNVSKTNQHPLPELSDDSGPEEIKISTESVEPIAESSTEKKAQKRKASVDENVTKIEHKSIKTNQKPIEKIQQTMYRKRMLPKTLLEKLLENDIRHERNVLLQCVHHIVKSNFFDENK